MQVFGVGPDEIETALPRISWHLEGFAESSNGEATASDIAQEIISHNRQCWIAYDDEIRAVALTQVIEGRITIVEITHCAGRGRDDWQWPLVSFIRDWAKSIGATRFKTTNRPGHTRFLKSMGLKETHRVMEQDI